MRIIFYLPHDHPELSLGVSHALDCYIRAVGQGPHAINSVYFSHDEGMHLASEEWSAIHHLLKVTKHRSFPADYEAWERREIEKRGFERRLRLTGGEENPNGYQFEYRTRIPWQPAPERTVASLLSATVPLEYLEAHGPGRVRQLALDMASRLPFASGHVGIALHLEECLQREDDAFRTQVLLYPGLDLRAAWRREHWVGTWVDGIHWLNFLGPPTLETLGGPAVLRTRLDSADTELVELDPQRVLLCLGERPDAGDISEGVGLPAYRELARVLEPRLEPFFLPPKDESGEEARYTKLLLTEDEVRRWWHRFLD